MSIGLQAYLQGYMHEKTAAPLKDQDVNITAPGVQRPPAVNPLVTMKDILPGGRASLGEVGPSGARAASPVSLAAMDVTGDQRIPWHDSRMFVSKNKKDLALLQRQGVPHRDDDIQGPPGPYGVYDPEAYFPHMNKLKGNVETAK